MKETFPEQGVPRPSLNQLPSFAKVYRWLEDSDLQCIWYMPGKATWCQWNIDQKDNDEALDRAKQLCGFIVLSDIPLVEVTRLIEQCCCVKHRHLVKHTGLLEYLAIEWKKELAARLPKIIQYLIERKQTLSIHQTRVTNEAYKPSPNLNTLSKASQETVQGSTSHSSWSNGLPATTFIDLTIERTSDVFEPYVMDQRSTLVSKLTLPIHMEPFSPRKGGRPARNDSSPGSIYLFNKTNHPGMVKIGYTRSYVDERLDYYAECGHEDPLFLRKFTHVPYPKRVETLIHLELIQHRRMLWCSNHQQAHTEWFEIDVQTAVSTARKWVEWMKRTAPYNADGYLKPWWKDLILELEKQNVRITARLLLELSSIDEIGEIEEISAQSFRTASRSDFSRAEWVKQAAPYDCDGRLRPTWRFLIDELRAHRFQVNIKLLLDFQKLGDDPTRTLSRSKDGDFDEWVRCADPYDSEGRLKILWKETVEGLCQLHMPITGRLLLELQELVENPMRMNDLRQ